MYKRSVAIDDHHKKNGVFFSSPYAGRSVAIKFLRSDIMEIVLKKCGFKVYSHAEIDGQKGILVKPVSRINIFDSKSIKRIVGDILHEEGVSNITELFSRGIRSTRGIADVVNKTFNKEMDNRVSNALSIKTSLKVLKSCFEEEASFLKNNERISLQYLKCIIEAIDKYCEDLIEKSRLPNYKKDGSHVEKGDRSVVEVIKGPVRDAPKDSVSWFVNIPCNCGKIKLAMNDKEANKWVNMTLKIGGEIIYLYDVFMQSECIHKGEKGMGKCHVQKWNILDKDREVLGKNEIIYELLEISPDSNGGIKLIRLTDQDAIDKMKKDSKYNDVSPLQELVWKNQALEGAIGTAQGSHINYVNSHDTKNLIDDQTLDKSSQIGRNYDQHDIV